MRRVFQFSVGVLSAGVSTFVFSLSVCVIVSCVNAGAPTEESLVSCPEGGETSSDTSLGQVKSCTQRGLAVLCVRAVGGGCSTRMHAASDRTRGPSEETRRRTH